MSESLYYPVRHRAHTRDAYDQLAGVWSATTDDGPYDGGLERPALRSLVPQPLRGQSVLDAGCGSGAQCAWLLDHGAEAVGVDLSPGMVDEAARRCGSLGRFLVADLAEPLPVEPGSFDGITCSLALHYLRDWTVPLQSFAAALRPGGWAVISLDHPFGPRLPDQRGGYFDTELVNHTWRKGDVEVTQQFWRRPLGAAVDAFTDAGFVVDRIAEARPSADALRRWPADLAGPALAPSFMCTDSGSHRSDSARRRLTNVCETCQSPGARHNSSAGSRAGRWPARYFGDVLRACKSSPTEAHQQARFLTRVMDAGQSACRRCRLYVKKRIEFHCGAVLEGSTSSSPCELTVLANAKPGWPHASPSEL